MLVRLFEVRAEDLVHLVGDLSGFRRATGTGAAAWPPGTRCLEVALASEERDPPASRAVMGHQLARIWSGLLPGLLPDEPGLVHLLRIRGSWEKPDALKLLAHVNTGKRRFAVTGARRLRSSESLQPMAAVVELTRSELLDAIEQWGGGGREVAIEVITLTREAATAALRSDPSLPITDSDAARGVRLYLTGSRDQRSLFIISSHTPETVRHLLEASTAK